MGTKGLTQVRQLRLLFESAHLISQMWLDRTCARAYCPALNETTMTTVATMPTPQQTDAPATNPWRWHVLALLLVLGVAGFRIWYLASACNLDLAPDEAHYWDW